MWAAEKGWWPFCIWGLRRIVAPTNDHWVENYCRAVQLIDQPSSWLGSLPLMVHVSVYHPPPKPFRLMTLLLSFSSLSISSLRLSLSTVLKCVLTFHFSFHFNVHWHFLFLCRWRACLLTYCISYCTSEPPFQPQPWAIELGALLKHILQRPKLLCFFRPSRYDISIVCKYIHFNIVGIRPVIVSECFHATNDFRLITRPPKILRNLQGKMGYAWSWTFLCQSHLLPDLPHNRNLL